MAVLFERAIASLRSYADADRAVGARAYHKAAREYLGVPNPVLNDLSREWRQDASIEDRVTLARAMWDTNIHEARIVAAKLLTQARIAEDDAVWALLQSWVPQFDAWAISDHACIALQKRLIAHPERIDTVEAWTTDPHMWTRRAALVSTLPWTKMNHPSPEDIAIRERILGWAAGYVSDRDWFIQKAVAWWIRDLSKHDIERARGFVDAHGDAMKPFARREAMKYM